MKCVLCGQEHKLWRSRMSTGSICPNCWAAILRQQRKNFRGTKKYDYEILTEEQAEEAIRKHRE